MSQLRIRELISATAQSESGAMVVSVEECLAELDQAYQTVDGLLVSAERLSHLQDIANLIPENTVATLALFEHALESITDQTAIDMTVPALEGYVDGQLSNESFKERLQQIIQWIMDRLRDAIRWIKALWARVTDQTTYQRARMKFLKEKHHQRKGRFPKNPTLALDGIAHQLVTFYGPPTDVAMIIRLASLETSQLTALRDRYVPIVRDVFRAVNSKLDNPDWGEQGGLKWLGEMNEACERMDARRLRSMLSDLTAMSDPRFEKGSAYRAEALLGDRALIVVDGAAGRPKSKDIMERSRELRRTGIRFTRPRPAPIRRDGDGRVEVPSPEHTTIGTLIEVTDALLKLTESIDGRGLDQELANTVSRLDRLARSLPSDGDNRAVYQACLAYVNTMQRWYREPYLSMLGHSVDLVGKLITVCNRSLNNL